MTAPAPLEPAGEQQLRRYRELWALTARDAGFQTNSAWLQRVEAGGPHGVLKIAKPDSDERPGMALLAWWAEQALTHEATLGAARVLRRDADALVMSQAQEAPALGDPRAFDDGEAFAILVQTVLALHQPLGSPANSDPSPTKPPPPGLVPLTAVREHVFGIKAVENACFERWRAFAQSLDVMGASPLPLHGDIHHGNVLWDSEIEAWVLIDPKGLLGHPAYDFANLFFNPMDQPDRVGQPGRMERLVALIEAQGAGLVSRQEVLDFAYLYGGMSLLWGWHETWAPQRLRQFRQVEALRQSG